MEIGRTAVVGKSAKFYKDRMGFARLSLGHKQS